MSNARQNEAERVLLYTKTLFATYDATRVSRFFLPICLAQLITESVRSRIWREFSASWQDSGKATAEHRDRGNGIQPSPYSITNSTLSDRMQSPVL